jgi:pimeloyl-ACP methyl ester carboxylesterase
MPRSLLVLAASAALVYLALCLLLFVGQRALIYLPHPPSPGGHATTTLAADGVALRIATQPHPGPRAVVYFGGNAEDVSFSLPDLRAAFPQHALYLLHYRGYGGSGGRPSEAALFADALLLFDRVRAEHPEVTVVGRSLGSGVAVHVAARRPLARLVLVTPYDSIETIAAGQFPVFPVRWLLRDKFESWRDAPRIDVTTLVIAAERDEVIPRASTEALLRHFGPGVATLKVIAGTSHNTVSASPDYVALLKGTSP